MLRQKQSELAKSVQDVKFRYNLMTEKYEMQKKHFEEVLSRDNTDLEDKRKLIADNHKDNLVYKDKLEKLNEEIISKKQKLWHKDEENSKQTKLAKLEAKIETNIASHKKTLEFFEKNNNCPTCTQKIEQVFKVQKCQHEKTKIDKLEKNLQDLLVEIAKNDVKVKELNVLSDKLSNLNVDGKN